MENTDNQVVKVTVTPENISNKIVAVHSWRSTGKFCACAFNFDLSRPADLEEIASLTEDLLTKVKTCASVLCCLFAGVAFIIS